MAPYYDGFPYREATVVFFWLTYFFEMYLQYRQHRRFSIAQIPVELQGVISQEVYDKSRAYGRDKSTYMFAYQTFSLIETTVCEQSCPPKKEFIAARLSKGLGPCQAHQPCRFRFERSSYSPKKRHRMIG